jgi:hypothetical protein
MGAPDIASVKSLNQRLTFSDQSPMPSSSMIIYLAIGSRRTIRVSRDRLGATDSSAAEGPPALHIGNTGKAVPALHDHDRHGRREGVEAFLTAGDLNIMSRDLVNGIGSHPADLFVVDDVNIDRGATFNFSAVSIIPSPGAGGGAGDNPGGVEGGNGGLISGTNTVTRLVQNNQHRPEFSDIAPYGRDGARATE